MTRQLLRAMLLNEARLRLRRGSTHVLLLVFTLVVWFMIVDPATGFTMLAVKQARVAYNSTCLALGSSLIVTVMLGLFGFYLARGRSDEDLRSGMGSVLAATPASNASLILGRWAGGVIYLTALVVVLMFTMCLLQVVRGEGPVEPAVFLQFYALTILPNIFFIVAMAVLCESCQPLMGKMGDLLYFTFWLGQVVAGTVLVSLRHDSSALLLFDATGIGTVGQRASDVLHTSTMAVGLNKFNPELPLLYMANTFWTWQMILTRIAASLVAVIPLAIAALLFHRFSPDQVKPSASRKRWNLVATLNRVLRPLDLVSRLMLRWSARLPRIAGQVAAELALTFAASPLTGALLLAMLAAGATLDYALLPWLLLAAVVYWGVVIADLSVRDFKADVEHLSAAAPGGVNQRYWRQCASAVLLGFLLTAPVLVRWGMAEPLRALCLASGIVALTGLAQLLGRTTRSGRAFTVLFLFGAYVANQAHGVAALDVVGVYGSATASSIAQQFMVGIALLAAGFGYNRRRGLQ